MFKRFGISKIQGVLTNCLFFMMKWLIIVMNAEINFTPILPGLHFPQHNYKQPVKLPFTGRLLWLVFPPPRGGCHRAELNCHFRAVYLKTAILRLNWNGSLFSGITALKFDSLK